MALQREHSVGYLFLQVALGLFFLVSGIWTLQGSSGNEIAVAIKSVLSGDSAQISCIVFGIIEVLAGIFLLLRMFVTFSSPIDTILMVIIMIAWIASIILIDFLEKGALPAGNFASILRWLKALAYHLLVLGAVITVRN
jgi:uncharacterized membrane protein YphA (DoxX/SURF4 family)